MNITVHDNVPLPTKRMYKQRATKYPWNIREGQSFFVSSDNGVTNVQTIRSSANSAAKRYNDGRKYRVAKREDGSIGVWRLPVS